MACSRACARGPVGRWARAVVSSDSTLLTARCSGGSRNGTVPFRKLYRGRRQNATVPFRSGGDQPVTREFSFPRLLAGCTISGPRAATGRRRRSAAGTPCWSKRRLWSVSYTHLRAHETVLDLVCRLLLE